MKEREYNERGKGKNCSSTERGDLGQKICPKLTQVPLKQTKVPGTRVLEWRMAYNPITVWMAGVLIWRLDHILSKTPPL